jgi:hypothetical protein
LEGLLEHFLFKPADDLVFLDQIHDRRVAFENLRAAFARIVDELRHVALFVADVGKRLRALFDRAALHPRPQRVGFPIEKIVEQLFRGVRPMDFLHRL